LSFVPFRRHGPQPALPKAQWRAEVEKMRNAYKATIDPKDVDAMVH
jgi:hypothetical protein